MCRSVLVEVKQINQLMVAMGRNQIKKLRWKADNEEIELELCDTGSASSFISEQNGEHGFENPLKGDFEKHRSEFEKYRTLHTESMSVEKNKAEMKEEGDSCVFVTSPMVGTVYMSPSPTDKPFVQVGDMIEENTVVCIIEAMKVMNEVKAGVRGIVKEILIESAQPVDFGAKLFKLVS